MKNPTQTTDCFFIHRRSLGYSFRPKIPTGKWCIILNKGEVDKAWEKVKELVDKDIVPYALVSTSIQSERYNGTYVICVFCHAYHVEITSCRKALKEVGFGAPIKYKLDATTVAGIYSGDEEWLIDETISN